MLSAMVARRGAALCSGLAGSGLCPTNVQTSFSCVMIKNSLLLFGTILINHSHTRYDDVTVLLWNKFPKVS